MEINEFYDVILPNGTHMVVQPMWVDDDGNYQVYVLKGPGAIMAMIRSTDFYTRVDGSLEVFDRD
jgi:hypothetical protein